MTSISRHHIEWLSLIEISGPFLSIPVLNECFPQGLDAHDPDLSQDLRAAHEEWLDNQGGLNPDPQIHQAWIDYVLQRVLDFDDQLLLKGKEIPENLSAKIEDRLIRITPDIVLLDPAAKEDKPAFIIQTFPPDQDLDKPPQGDPSQESIQTRMMLLLHALDLHLGMVTNGRAWMLVYTPQGETTSFITWYSYLWLDEPLTLRAFRTFLKLGRFFGVPDKQTLVGMLQESAEKQQDVTTQLGSQVRSAVEILIQSLDEADKDLGGELLKSLGEADLFEAALTVMMRLVFLLSAEERKLFPVDDPFYAQNYAVSTLRGQLREKADQLGEDVLDYHYDAWFRLLAAFRMVYAGTNHDRLNQPAYGGSLFDPDRFPFLEGRSGGQKWFETPAEPLPINNRTILHILDALQSLLVDIPGGGKQAQQLSFRALDIEQIGHIYESLLDHKLKRAYGVVVGLKGTKDKEPEIPLEEFERRAISSEDTLIDFLEERTGRSRSALKNDLHRETDLLDLNKLQVACENDQDLMERLNPYFSLIREDDFEKLMVISDSSFYLTEGTTRRSTGTHYTPRTLTKPIVQHTLDPQVYFGPAQGFPREEWQLKTPEMLLNLKICDMAMGSGAFLVQVIRYLGDRLVESWGRFAPIEPKGPKSQDYDIFGNITENPRKMLPRDPEERHILARRLVSERCIYGVDKNPLAVEMAKLSLWLVTLAKGRPFGFLDHALKCGDSLVGTDPGAFRRWAKDISGTTTSLFDKELTDALKEAQERRRELEAFEVRDIQDIALKEQLYQQAEEALEKVKVGADILTGLDLMDLTEDVRQLLKARLLISYVKGQADTSQALLAREKAEAEKAFHWFLKFPEVFQNGGFDAFVGNPPFMGGQKISGEFGDYYLDYLTFNWDHSSGSTDLCAYFFLQAYRFLKVSGTFGLIATNTIAQGPTRERGLAYILDHHGNIYRAMNNYKWPGSANVIVDITHISKGHFKVSNLDGKDVITITSFLDSLPDLPDPYALEANEGKSYQGVIVLGMGFVLSYEEAQNLIIKDPKNAAVLLPYLNGQDLNNQWDQTPRRWVINFFDWPIERVRNYPDCFEIIKNRVKPFRDKNNDDKAREYWWRYLRPRPEMHDSIKELEEVIVLARITKYLGFIKLKTGIVFNEKTIIFPEISQYPILQSMVHREWAWRFSSTLGASGLNYSPNLVYKTFPFPDEIIKVQEIGDKYHQTRELIMSKNHEGLTDTYNRFHDSANEDKDIEELRSLQIVLDRNVVELYGWSDMKLSHDFQETDIGMRFTISEEARKEILMRLVHLNHQRYEEEVLEGLHGEKARKKWIKEHGISEKGRDQKGQLSFIGEGPKQETLLNGNVKEQNQKKPTYYRCWKCGKLVLAEDREQHTKEAHCGKNPGYARVGKGG